MDEEPQGAYEEADGIGGIEADDIPAIMRTGVSGIALSGTVLRAQNPVEEMRKLMDLMK